MKFHLRSACILLLFTGLFTGAAIAQTSTQAVLQLSTTTLSAQVAAGSNAPSTSFDISNTGGGTLAPALATSATWVQAAVSTTATCTAATGTGCQEVTVSFNSASLSPASYTASIYVSDASAVNAPQIVNVTLLVVGVPSSITVYAAPDGGAIYNYFYALGSPQVSASTASGGSWLSASSQSPFGGAAIEYEVDVNSQTISTPGTYQGTIVLSGSNFPSDNKTINVTLIVTTSPIAAATPAQLNLVAGTGLSTVGYVTLGNSGQGSLTIASATPSVSWLAAAASGSTLTVTANATGLQPGLYSGTIAVASNAANATLSIPVSFLVTTQTGPQIAIGGVVDNAVGIGPVSPGDIAVAYGSNFTSATPQGAQSTPIATNLAGVQVLVNGTAAPIYFISPNQIDFQMPYATTAGTADIQVVNNSSAGNTVSVTVGAIEPKILVFLGYSGQPPIIVNFADGSIATTDSGFTALPAHAASPGDTLVMYAIGLGQTSPAATTGAAASSTTLETINPASVMITLGGGFVTTVPVTPAFVGLAPGFVGLYQINFVLPSNAPIGSSVYLMLSVNGASSNPVNIAIQ
jgi:uncharacterized protein (TIGR03437 family)